MTGGANKFQRLFVDCDWNSLMVAFRGPFSSFADWSRDETAYQPASVKMIAFSDDDLSVAVQDFLRSNGISTQGMKTYGGAGQILWLENGRLLDSADCGEFLRDVPNLKTRTQQVFRPPWLTILEAEK